MLCHRRSILKHMGLQGTVTHCQASKKWDNLKKKYKVNIYHLMTGRFSSVGGC